MKFELEAFLFVVVAAAVVVVVEFGKKHSLFE